MSGNRRVIVTTDATNQLFEHTRESNNTAIDDRPMTVSPRSYQRIWSLQTFRYRAAQCIFPASRP